MRTLDAVSLGTLSPTVTVWLTNNRTTARPGLADTGAAPGTLATAEIFFSLAPGITTLLVRSVYSLRKSPVSLSRAAVSCCLYPTAGTRSVYFPQRSMNKAGLLGYAGNWNKNAIVALQVETASCIENIEEIAAVPGVDMLFLGQNDLCMSMGLYEKYEFPHMYTSPELGAATDKLVAAARKNNVTLGVFLFGTSRVQEFLDKGFPFISVGNDLHHVLTQAGAHITALETMGWKRRPTALL